MEHYHKVHTTYVVDFTFINNITFLTGDSGQGKSAVFSFFEEDAARNPQLLCFNYLDWRKDIAHTIADAEGKLIVVDNADLLLTDEMRKHIALDVKNQYLLIGRDPRNLYATKDNIFELVSERKGEKTEFRIEAFE
ncbi:MAG: ABC transporter ATP-binding protein [Clostridiales bacterium]|nr:ABC transporter ATP-binding protein [Clostridiales bacterium]